MTTWTKVTDALPPPETDVLVWAPFHMHVAGIFTEGKWETWSCQEVYPTHWMPLPKGPHNV